MPGVTIQMQGSYSHGLQGVPAEQLPRDNMTQVTCVDKCGVYGSCTGVSCRRYHPYTDEHCDAWLNGTSIHGG